MKKMMGLAIAALLIYACGDISREKEALRKVSAEWKKTYALVNAMVDRAETDQINWQEQYERMQLSADEMASLDEQTLNQLMEIKTTCREHGATYDVVAEAVEAFAIHWEEQTAQLEALEKQLQEDQKPADLAGKTASFEATLSEVEPKISNWEKQLDMNFESCQQTCRHFEKLASGEVN